MSTDASQSQRPDMRNFSVVGGMLLTDEGHVVRIHPPWKCVSNYGCVLHKSSHHNMCRWPVQYSATRGRFERLCGHGVGHPDPDQFQFCVDLGKKAVNRDHDCCGCCRLAARRTV